MSVLLLYISFIVIKCEWEWVDGIWGPLPKMVKVKIDKFLGMDENRISDKFLGTKGTSYYGIEEVIEYAYQFLYTITLSIP